MKVKLQRIKCGLTQVELCKKIKMSPKKLCEVEKGNYEILTLANMKKLAEVLNTDVQTLFFSED